MSHTALATDLTPRIDSITPAAAIPGGEVAIRGNGFGSHNGNRPRVQFGDAEANLVIAGESQLIARVPEGPSGSSVRVATALGESDPYQIQLGVQIADNLHPVANPAVDPEGNIYVTYSGQRGQKVPVSLYKITANYQVKPFVTELMNPTGLALDESGNLYVSCRNDGTIHRVTPDGRSQPYVEGMGIAYGLAFDADRNLFFGDRSGTIFKISPDRQIFVFATLEPSMSAYHLAFNPAGDCSSPGQRPRATTASRASAAKAQVSLFFRGLGRPQGLAFDRDGNLYVAASLGGRRGIVRITPEARAELVLSGTAWWGCRCCRRAARC